MLGEIFGELIVKPFFEFVCYGTGRPVIRLLSGGCLHASLSAEASDKQKRQRRWYSCTFMRGEKRFVDVQVVIFVGMLVWAAVIGALVLITRCA